MLRYKGEESENDWNQKKKLINDVYGPVEQLEMAYVYILINIIDKNSIACWYQLKHKSQVLNTSDQTQLDTYPSSSKTAVGNGLLPASCRINM